MTLKIVSVALVCIPFSNSTVVRPISSTIALNGLLPVLAAPSLENTAFTAVLAVSAFSPNESNVDPSAAVFLSVILTMLAVPPTRCIKSIMSPPLDRLLSSR